MMHLIFDAERMKYKNVGLYHYCKSLGEALIKQKEENEISIFTPASLRGSFGNSVNYVDVKWYNKFVMPSLASGVWHTTHQLSDYFPSKKLKKVLTIHDLNFIHDNPSQRRVQKYLTLIQKHIDSADHIVCISNFTKGDVLKYLKIENKPVSVIYNGHSLRTHKLEVPKKYAAQQFLFTIGAIAPKKNFHVLPCLLVGNDLHLIIAGNHNHAYADKILIEAKRFNVADRVHLIGQISEGEKAWYYSNCTAFVFPSIAEGFGLPVIEAMQFGKPVFLSMLTSLPEIGGDSASYFQNFEPAHMQHILKEGLMRYKTEHPSEKIKQWASKFSWENAAKQYWKIYTSLAS